MSTGKKALIVGAGFIGWNVLDLLVKEGYDVSAIVRRQQHADQIAESGAHPILSDLDDKALITKHTAENSIIIHCAGADHLSSVSAILDGLALRANEGKPTIYIHTSGAKVLNDNALGAFKSETVYHDDKIEDVDWVADDAPHRPVDLMILNAQKRLAVATKIAIVFPPEVYGYDTKHDRLSIMMPRITRFALRHGYVPYVGQGLAVETQVHVLDLARAYMVILQWMARAEPADLLANPYFFCENGEEFAWGEAAGEIAGALGQVGRMGGGGEVRTGEVGVADWGKLFGERTGAYMGLNCRGRAVRLRALGWEPREKGIWESFTQDELPVILTRWDAEREGREDGEKEAKNDEFMNGKA